MGKNDIEIRQGMIMGGNRRKRSISVVMCTFNGERYLREQLDSILRQTYPVAELIVQDDGSTDNTCAIVQEYAERYPFIRLYRNDAKLGINRNFFSAMQRSQGDLIAISDQDDVWESDKLEKQMDAIGDKMLCTGKSSPFVDEKDIHVSIDMRPANYNLLRILFVGAFAGHATLFTRALLDETLQLSPFFPPRLYDVILGLVAAAHDSIVYIDAPLVRHRRHLHNATKTYFSVSGNRKTIGNIKDTAKEAWRLYRKLRPGILQILKSEERFLSEIHSQAPIRKEGLKILHLYSSRYLTDFIRLCLFCARRGNLLTFAQGRQTLSTYLRGAVFPIYSALYYKHLL